MRRRSILFAGAAITAGTLCTTAGAQPSNDTCIDAPFIGVGSVNGTTRGAAPNGDSTCGNSANAPDVYYRFIAPADCEFEVLTCDGNTDYDTVVSVHSDCPATAANTIACSDDGAVNCDPLRSYTTFNAQGGNVYTIRVSGFSLNRGDFTLIIRQLGRPANDTCAAATPIGGDGAFIIGNTTCAASEGTVNCLIATTDTPNQFFRYTAHADGVVTFETCDPATQYDTYLSASTDCPHSDTNIIACNDDFCGRSSRIAFGVAAGSSYIVRVSGFGGARGQYVLRWTFGQGDRPNDSCFGAQPITIGSTINGTTVGANADDHVSCFPFDTPDVYYRLISPTETFVTLDTCGPGTSFDSVLSVHSSCPASDANLIACNDDACDVRSAVTFLAKPGVHYFVRVAGFRDFGTYTLAVNADVDAVVFDPSTLGEYYLLGDRHTIGDFRARAAALGAHMATIHSFSENQFVADAVMQSGNIARSVAIGLHDETTEGELQWDTGQPLDFTFFINGQPDDFNGAEDNIHVLPFAGLWNDYPNGAYPGLFGAAESDRSIIAQAVNPANGHLYLLYRASSWEGAQARARAMGGNLVTIDGPAENEFIRSRFASEIQGDLWIGLSDAVTEGTPAWADGSNASFRNFAAGEPNNFGGDEDYVELNTSTGQWNDVPNIQSGRPNHGVAEIVLPTAISKPIQGPDGCGRYVLLSQSGFYPALFAAERMGGHLVSITSAQENEFIRDAFADAGGGRRLWLGATDRDDDGNFIWLNNEPFGYTNFLAGEPNNFGGNEDYLEMFDPATGVWNDMSTIDPSAPTHFGVVELSCPCDWDASGDITSQDFFDFLTDFFASNANINCDAVTNSQDFFDFLTCFFEGCVP